MDNGLINDLLAIKELLDLRLKVKPLAEALEIDERTLKSHLKKAKIQVDKNGAIQLLEVINLIGRVASEMDQRLSKNKLKNDSIESKTDSEELDVDLSKFILGGDIHCKDPVLMVKFQEATIKAIKALKALGQLVELDVMVDILRVFVTLIITNCDKAVLDAQRSMDVDKITITQEIANGIRTEISRALEEQIDKYQFQSSNVDLTYLYDNTELG